MTKTPYTHRYPIPAGWEMLEPGTVIDRYDKFESSADNDWAFTSAAGTVVGSVGYSCAYIREIKKMTKVNIAGKKYEINVDAALKHGVLVKVPTNRSIKYEDLRNGDIVQWRSPGQGWSGDKFLMVDIELNHSGQTIDLTNGGHAFFHKSKITSYRVLQPKTNTWLEVITE